MTWPETPEFKKAAEDAKKLTSKPSQDDLLELYALYKLGRDETPEKGGMFNIAAKYKYEAWKKLKDEGVTPDEAQKRYVKKVEEMKVTYGYDESKEPEAVGSS